MHGGVLSIGKKYHVALQKVVNPLMPSQSVIPVYKPLGITPLQALHSLRKANPSLQDETLAYAGRLDPMAEGLLLVLVGDECKKREHYQMLPKTYEVTILFGFATDTYDMLGLITHRTESIPADISHKVSTVLPEFVGKHDQAYPPYSSARVNGKPLFYWARKGLLDTITIPTKNIEIKEVSLISSKTYSSHELLSSITPIIAHISGDFRQDEILRQWKKELSHAPKDFPVLTIQVDATQGAYMRSLAHEIGARVGIPALALSIKRLTIGEYQSNEAFTIPVPAVS